MNQVSREKEIYRVTIVGGIVNLILLIIKFIAGFVGHSTAMVADAAHSLSDFVTDIIVILFVRLSSKPADKSHAYGHGKYETLATAIIGFLLLAVGIGILFEGINKIASVINGEVLDAPGIIAFIVAAISIVSKELVYRYTVFKGRSLNSQAVIANAWHHRSDAFSSIGALVGIGFAVFGGEKWRVLDPIAAIIVSAFIIKVAIKILKDSLSELLEHSLPKSKEDEIREIILSVEGVVAPHNLRTRRIGNSCAIDVHIRMDGNISLNEAHDKTIIIEKLLKEQYGAGTYVSIHTEPYKTTQ